MPLCWIKRATLCDLKCWLFNTLKQDLYLALATLMRNP